MKRKLLFLIMSIAFVQFANAQVVELVGIGVENINPSTIFITDPGTVDHVVVEAAAVFRGVSPVNVTFSDANENYDVAFNLTEQDFAPTVPNGGVQKWGYYTATFTDVDAGGITLDNMNQLENVISFTAYVYRTGGNPYAYTMVEYDHAFVFHNGSGDPLIYDFTLPWSMDSRDIEVDIPISELTEDNRFVNIKLSAGAQSTELEFDSNNLGHLLNIQNITLPNVPGDITDVKLEIYSPTLVPDGKEGDSFITGALLITTTVNQGCTYTQGYWKTHSEYGPASKPDATWEELTGGPDTEFYLSGMSWIDVFNTPGKGNAYYPLAHQFMAAYLNILSGTMVPAEVQNAWDTAASVFSAKAPDYYKKVKGKSDASKEEIAQLNKLASTLTDYNEGTIGPGHCGDEILEWEKSGSITKNEDNTQLREFMVYPNPINGVATISFSPKNNGNAQVLMYNSNGQKVSTLFNQNVRQDIPVTLQLNGNNYNEGLYLLLLQNETSSESQKLIIKR